MERLQNVFSIYFDCSMSRGLKGVSLAIFCHCTSAKRHTATETVTASQKGQSRNCKFATLSSLNLSHFIEIHCKPARRVVIQVRF